MLLLECEHRLSGPKGSVSKKRDPLFTDVALTGRCAARWVRTML